MDEMTIKDQHIFKSINHLLSNPHISNNTESLLKIKSNLMYMAKQNNKRQHVASDLSDMINKIDNKLYELKQLQLSTIPNKLVNIIHSSTAKNVELTENTSAILIKPTKNPQKNQVGSFSVIHDEITQSSSSESTTSASRLHLLLKKQKDLTAQELELENKRQHEMTTELTQLTSVLKQATMQMNESVRQQNLDLDSLRYHTVDNMSELENQKKKMDQQEKKATTSLLTSISSMLAIIIAFVLTYIVIRLFPKP